MKKVRFPLELLFPKIGTMSWSDFGASVEIPLEPFVLPYGGRIETRILIDCLPFERGDAASLAGRSHQFPLDHEAERPEGSIYVGHAHHPVDLIAIAFGRAEGDEIDAHLALGFAFDFEGLAASEDSEYGDIGWQVIAQLVVRTPSTIH